MQKLGDAFLLKAQYEEVMASRRVLFDYCASIHPADFVCALPHFGRGGMIRNVLVHIANTYEFWIGKWALQRNLIFTAYEDIDDMQGVTRVFENVDVLVFEFFDTYLESQKPNISISINGKSQEVHFVKLFTHVITHEFHHKGQILSMSRQLGYTPVDTDIMR